MRVSVLFQPAAAKADPDAEAEYRRRLYAAHRAAGWAHADALSHTNRDAAAGLWRGAFPGLGLGTVPADETPGRVRPPKTPTLFDVE